MTTEYEAACPLCGAPATVEYVTDVWFEDRHTLALGVESNCPNCPFTYHGHVPVEKDGGFIALLSEGKRDE